MKSNRQTQILELIASTNIETQNQLMEELRVRGIKSTQATLSRDIKELRLVKELSPTGGYRYAAPAREDNSDVESRLRKIFRESVVGIDIAENILVIHTLPGLANGAASALDSLEIPSLVGTLAGDDTAFLAMRTKEDAVIFRQEIEAML